MVSCKLFNAIVAYPLDSNPRPPFVTTIETIALQIRHRLDTSLV